MAVAYRLHRGELPGYRAILVVGIVFFAVCAGAEDLGWMDGYGSLARIAYGLASALVILGAAETSREGVARVPSILQILGSASYSLYLFQFVFVGIAWKLWLATGLGATVSPVIGCVVFCLATLGGGIMMSRLVEYPLMRLIRGAIPGRDMRKGAVVVPKLPAA